MEPAQALADLMEISSQVEAAVLLDESGAPVASTLADDERATRLAGVAGELLTAAEAAGERAGLTQLEAATREGSVFVVRDAGRVIAATTAPSPTVGLVFYDLKTCLRAAVEQPSPPEKPKRRRRRKADEGDAAA